MASCTARKNKAGEVISYQIKVARGRDKLTGKQLTPFTMTYTPPAGWSRKAVERELMRVMGEFESACNRGEILTRAQMKEKELERIALAEKKREEEARRPTFAAYVERFMKAKAVSLSPNTMILYRRTFDRAMPVFGIQKMEAITMQSIKDYIIDLQLNGKNRKTGRPIAYNTFLKHYLNLHSLFEAAVEDEVIKDNPMRRIKRPKPRKGECSKKACVYDETEVKYIIECANKEPLKWRAFILLALDTGCRKGEMLGLKWSDIDFKTGRVVISRNVQYTDSKTGVYITTPKSGRERIITVNEPVLEALSALRVEQLRKIPSKCMGYCFARDNGDVMHPSTPVGYMRWFGKRYNLPGIHCHAFRHTMASLAITNGADPVSVSAKLGHSKPSITLDVYSHASEESQRRTNEILAGALYGGKYAP